MARTVTQGFDIPSLQLADLPVEAPSQVRQATVSRDISLARADLASEMGSSASSGRRRLRLLAEIFRALLSTAVDPIIPPSNNDRTEAILRIKIVASAVTLWQADGFILSLTMVRVIESGWDHALVRALASY